MSEYNPRQPYIVSIGDANKGEIIWDRIMGFTPASASYSGRLIVLTPHGDPLPEPEPVIADCVCGEFCYPVRDDNDCEHVECQCVLCGYACPSRPNRTEAILLHNRMMAAAKEAE